MLWDKESLDNIKEYMCVCICELMCKFYNEMKATKEQNWD